jgi:hypothetical protein
MRRGEVPADKYPEVKDFWDKLAKHNDQYIVLKKKPR